MGLVVGVGAAFGILLDIDVIGWLERPMLPRLNGRKLVVTHPGDPFWIVLKAALVLGILLALPVMVGVYNPRGPMGSVSSDSGSDESVSR